VAASDPLQLAGQPAHLQLLLQLLDGAGVRGVNAGVRVQQRPVNLVQVQLREPRRHHRGLRATSESGGILTKTYWQ
jgi:hypothetical protein